MDAMITDNTRTTMFQNPARFLRGEEVEVHSGGDGVIRVEVLDRHERVEREVVVVRPHGAA